MRLAVAAITCAFLIATLLVFYGRESMADPNALGPDGFPIIFAHVEARDERKVAALLDAGADIEAKGFFDQTPMLKAAMANSWTMVAMLMERGADIRASDRSGFNLPYLASVSKIGETTENGKVLREVVRPVLEKAGLMERIYHPVEAEALMEQGEWPPVEWR